MKSFVPSKVSKKRHGSVGVTIKNLQRTTEILAQLHFKLKKPTPTRWDTGFLRNQKPFPNELVDAVDTLLSLAEEWAGPR